MPELALATTQISPDELDPELRNPARKRVIIGFFRRRYEYSDEIPPQERNSNTDDGPLIKARKSWFGGISCSFEDAIFLGLIKKRRNIEKAIKKFSSLDFCNTYHPLVTESDIQEGNDILDWMISKIDPQLINETLKHGIQFRLNIPWSFF